MTSIGLSAELASLHEREWQRIARPGTWFSGSERVAIAAAARGEEPSRADGVAGSAQVAAHMIYEAPATITRAWLAGLEADGLTLAQYVEVLGIVARLRANDTLMFGLGVLRQPLPKAVDGAPNPILVDAQLDGSWVPTVGVAFPPTVLSSVPAENDAMHDVHGVLYLAPTSEPDGHSMGNMSVVRDGVTRSQMEFVAARTSLLNDCFF